ncbi:2-amino-4-hydroxy-6-hydroxymethyldihydropteridine diphosphokinase [Bowmanella dokdonensis]|uniref:2-amino-4-hydroxy-6-hydroxymethyldihydropteridine pyrophosphokinase n=1 Tax=Bowmanella dokdonensis TaxID=751969 RepID=A0A939IRC4_9ALTE|nr:2-amino-4-hydroxy-6-hydroxymethyldihydropteridine diphosphokinase [Bowmanella dokdonensis]MBN7825959.1 2-amino-4-hydroxy-6-hydroxymethyldihydropteridine diphosphokinase [Bowmanella dokdonensis]
MIPCYIGLGSNLDNPARQLLVALKGMQTMAASRLTHCSSFYQSRPMGPPDQPDYVNAVARLETSLSAMELLRALQALEKASGRVRSLRWGARTLDLDVLLYGDQVIHNEALTVPHYGIAEREFVLCPLQEIAPQLVLPDGRSLAELVASCPVQGMQVIRQQAEVWTSLAGSV